MFWKFGFHNASAIDALLDRDEISLEAILDEDDLLQECKAQNTRLIDYFQRIDVLQRLFGYVSGNIEGEGHGRFKYPYVATEVLCSEIWSIVETCLSNINQLLTPFWDAVLDQNPEDMRTQNVMASHFAKINATFLSKKPAEMLAFIQAQPAVVERILRHIETPPFVDLLVRVIQLDEQPAGAGVLEWLSNERLIPRLVDLLSPYHTVSMHSVVSELIKGIISISAPSPGAGLTDAQNGPASNLFARQLARAENIQKLVAFMLDDFSFEMELLDNAKSDASSSNSKQTPLSSSSPSSSSSIPERSASPPIPNIDTATSSGVQAVSIIIELIRKNNSDYFEPYLFHTLRNRLIHVQQLLHVQSDDGRDALERAFYEMVDRMGVVHLGPLLEIMCDRLERFQQLLHKPRSSNDKILTTIGPVTPLTFERFRICELYAELLHCSNMSLLNRSADFDDLYDNEGRLRGGLSALEELARVIAIGSSSEEQVNMDDDGDEMEPAQELPVSVGSADLSTLEYSDEDEEMSDDEHGSSDDDVMEEIDMTDEPPAPTPPPMSPTDDEPLEQPPLIVPSSPNAANLPSPSELAAQGAALARSRSLSLSQSERSRSRPPSEASRRSARRGLARENSGVLPIGDKLKQRFAETRVLSTLLDLFFAFPWNNFLHSVVYDVLHQILTGRVDSGFNRELTIALFRDAHLLSRIVEAQKQNDIESAKPRHVRLGYMGHLTIISEDVIGALEHYPPDLKLLLAQYAPQPEWDDYVGGRYHETKTKDTSLLGGGKPVVAAGATRGGAQKWKVDEADAPAPVSGEAPARMEGGSEPKGEFRRVSRLTRETSADFGVPPFEAEEEEEGAGPSQFATYLAQAMSTSIASSSDGSDDEDEDGGWLSQSKFDLAPPPVQVRRLPSDRRPLSPGGFNDDFNPMSNASNTFDDHFGFDDDQMGPFSDSAAAASDGDPFSFAAIQEGGAEEASFGDFGDFGDFQSADGELTPTGGSWTFASDASVGSGSSDDAEVVDTDRSHVSSDARSEPNAQDGTRTHVDSQTLVSHSLH